MSKFSFPELSDQEKMVLSSRPLFPGSFAGSILLYITEMFILQEEFRMSFEEDEIPVHVPSQVMMELS